MIYLDNSATTIPNESILASYQQVAESYFANPSSLHGIGGTVEKLLTKAREQVSQILRVEEKEIVFTSGGTEGNNLAIKGIAMKHKNRGKHIITSMVEHPSVFEACKNLETLGFEITYLPVDHRGIVSIKELQDAIRDDTILISIMHVNNELGSIQPIKEIGKIAKKYPKLYFHVDDVQGLGKVPLLLPDSGIDLCTISGHKIHGLKGTGILFVRKGTSLFPLFHGGNQEYGYRSGTENVPGAVAIAKALRLMKENEQKNQQYLKTLQEYLRQHLSGLEGVQVNTPVCAAPHIMNISVPGIKPEVIVHMLGEQNIFISTKSACSSKSNDESRILAACGYRQHISTTALRISMTYTNTKEELSIFLQALKKAIKQLGKVLE